MDPSVLQAGGQGVNASGSYTIPTAVTAGSYLVLVFGGMGYASAAGTISAVSDDQNGDWEQLYAESGDDGADHYTSFAVWRIYNAKAGTTEISYTYAGGAAGGSIAVAEVGGIATSSPEDVPIAALCPSESNGSGVVTSPVSDSAQAGDFRLGLFMFYDYGQADLVAGSGADISTQERPSEGNNAGTIIEYYTSLTSAGTQTASVTDSDSPSFEGYGAAVLCLLPASGGGSLTGEATGTSASSGSATAHVARSAAATGTSRSVGSASAVGPIHASATGSSASAATATATNSSGGGEITFRSAAHVAAETSSSITGSIPSGAVATDVLLAWIYWDGDAADLTSAPSGWTQIDALTNSGLRGATFWALGNVANLTWDFSASCVNGMQILAYEGCDTSAPIDQHSLQHVNISGGTVSTEAIDVATGEWFVTFFGGYTTSCTFSTPSGLTSRDAVSGIAAFDSNGPDAGSSVSATSSPTPAPSEGVAAGIALVPGSGGGGTINASATGRSSSKGSATGTGGSQSYEFVEIGTSGNIFSTTGTITNTDVPIPAGAVLVVVVGGVGFTASAGVVSNVSDNVNGAWSEVYNSGNRVEDPDGHNSSIAVYQLVNSSEVADGGLTITITQAPGQYASTAVAAYLTGVPSSNPIDVYAPQDTDTSDGSGQAEQDIADCLAGDFLAGFWTAYSDDGQFVADSGQTLLVYVGNDSAGSTGITYLNDETTAGTNSLGVNYGGAGGPYNSVLIGYLPVSGATPVAATGTSDSGSTATAQLAQAAEATGASDSVGSATAALSMPRSASGQSASSATATAHVASPMAGAGVSRSSGTATAHVAQAVAATGESESRATATAHLAVPAAGTGQSASTATATARVDQMTKATGQSASSASATAAVTQTAGATGHSGSAGSATPAVSSHVTATGSSESGSTATARVLQSVTATGQSASSATATAIVEHAGSAQASGTSRSSGSATARMAQSAAAQRQSDSAGAATAAVAQAAQALGETASSGSATARVGQSVRANGASASLGSAEAVLSQSAGASGASASAGRATAAVARTAAATGASHSGAVATAAMQIVASATGQSDSSGSATISREGDLTGKGTGRSASSGSATARMAAAAGAAGRSDSTGTATARVSQAAGASGFSQSRSMATAVVAIALKARGSSGSFGTALGGMTIVASARGASRSVGILDNGSPVPGLEVTVRSRSMTAVVTSRGRSVTVRSRTESAAVT